MAGVGITNYLNLADGDAVTTTFNFTFFVYSSAYVKVYLVEDDVETLVNSGITVTVNSTYIGGAVVFDTAPTADQIVMIKRETPYTQPTQFTDLNRAREEATEIALNNLVLQIQQLKGQVDAAPKYQDHLEITGAQLPAPVADASICFDGTTGDLKVGPTIGDIEDAFDSATATATAAAATATAQASTATTAASNATTQAATAISAAATATAAVATTAANVVLTNADVVTTAASAAAAASSANDAANSAATFSVTGTSVSTVSVGTGSKSFTTQSGRSWVAGATRLRIATADATKIIEGEVTSYSGTSVTIDADYTEGSGSASAWNLAPIGPRGATGSSGSGSGDMVSTQNLADVANTATSFANIKQAATDSATGVVEIATDAEVQTGTDTARVVTPAGLQACTGTETRKGVLELATNAETQTGTDTARAITPANLQACTATETRKGVVELSTDAEAQTGTDTARAITPANLQAVTATETRKGVVELATNAEAQTGTDTARALTPANLQAVTGTETRAGVLELATTAETTTGTDTARAVTPAGVAAAIAAAGTSRTTLFDGNASAAQFLDVSFTAGAHKRLLVEIEDLAHSGSAAAGVKEVWLRMLVGGSPVTSGYNGSILNGATVTADNAARWTVTSDVPINNTTGLRASYIISGLDAMPCLTGGHSDGTDEFMNIAGLGNAGPFNGIRLTLSDTQRNLSTNTQVRVYGYN